MEKEFLANVNILVSKCCNHHYRPLCPLTSPQTPLASLKTSSNLHWVPSTPKIWHHTPDHCSKYCLKKTESLFGVWAKLWLNLVPYTCGGNGYFATLSEGNYAAIIKMPRLRLSARNGSCENRANRFHCRRQKSPNTTLWLTKNCLLIPGQLLIPPNCLFCKQINEIVSKNVSNTYNLKVKVASLADVVTHKTPKFWSVLICRQSLLTHPEKN